MIIKEAKTKHKIIDLISKRWSPRAFTDQAVTTESIKTILEAARWAPSARNEQPWEYKYAFKGTPGFETIANCLDVGNRLWASNAAVLIVSIANKTFGQNRQVNNHFMHDTGLANANLILQAFSMNIYSHIMAGFDKEKTIKIFGMSEIEEPVCFIALGYLGEAQQLNEPFKSRELAPRMRKSLEEISSDCSYFIR